MKDAQKLYKKTGFEYIEAPMGDTGHFFVRFGLKLT